MLGEMQEVCQHLFEVLLASDHADGVHNAKSRKK
jgi:hypothetical protein